MGVFCQPLQSLFAKRNWLVVLLLTFGLLGSYAVYDAPGALAVWLEEDLNIAPTRLGLLYSAYSAPIIIFALFCGNLADKFGVNIFIGIYQILTIVGAALFAIAYSKTEQVAFVIMMTSRIISGIGGEGLVIVSRKAVFSWFNEANLPLALSLIMTLPFFGTQYSFVFLPVIATNVGGKAAFWSVFMLCILCAMFSIIYLVITRLWPTEWETIDPAITDDTEKPVSWLRQFISAITSLQWRFWLVCIANMFTQGAIWPFVAFSPDFFYHHYGFSPEIAGIFATILAGSAIPLGILIGFVGRKVPKALVGINAAILQILCFLILGWATEWPCIIAILGLSVVLGSVGTANYAAISSIVPHENLGVVMGLMKSTESISWLITPPLYGAIYEYTHNFAWSCTLFSIMGIIPLLLHFVLLLAPMPKTVQHADVVL